MRRIKIWAEDFATDVWFDYCDICDMPHDTEAITIYFERAEGEKYE